MTLTSTLPSADREQGKGEYAGKEEHFWVEEGLSCLLFFLTSSASQLVGLAPGCGGGAGALGAVGLRAQLRHPLVEAAEGYVMDGLCPFLPSLLLRAGIRRFVIKWKEVKVTDKAGTWEGVETLGNSLQEMLLITMCLAGGNVS